MNVVCGVHRTAYYTAYRQVYRQDYQTVYKCCPGWSQLNGEAGCLYREYPFILKHFPVFESHGKTLSVCIRGSGGKKCLSLNVEEEEVLQTSPLSWL